MLAALLDGIAKQAVPPGYDTCVLVIDNDTEPSARALVEDKATAFPFGLQYVHHAEPGLSSVRNFALSYARETFDLLAMIDDDECPEPQWLGELIRVVEATHADAVIGPVPQRLPPDAPRWLCAGRFYDLPTYPDEATIGFGYSGNCMLRLASLERFGVVFDRRLNFAGGEDLLFFRQLLARGAKMSYAARAIATETVSAERLRSSYLLRLNFRRGNTLSICDLHLKASARGIALRAIKGCARILFGIATLLPRAAMRGRAGALRSSCDIAKGFGSLAGLLGYVHYGYERDDAARR